jgi:hypothetical protein
VLLFTNPKAHAEQCDGPFTTMPEPVHGTTGFGACGYVTSIDEIGVYGNVILVATPEIHCGGGCVSLTPNSWGQLPWEVWGEPLRDDTQVAINCP